MIMNIGEKIRGFRKEERMTLALLAEKSGVALATLSRIENGKMTGTLESHIKICEALGIPLSELYSDLSGQGKTPEVQTKETRADVFVHDKKTTAEMLTSKILNKKMMPVLIKLEPGGTTHKEETKRGVEKFCFVITGKVRIAIGKLSYDLKKGDSLYFDPSAVHYFKNAGTTEAQIVCVTSPPAL